MSLINQVLNDLEQRRAEASGGRLPRDVRALPAKPSRRGPVLAAVLSVVLAVPAGIWAWHEFGPGRPLPQVPELEIRAALSTALPPLAAQASEHVAAPLPQATLPATSPELPSAAAKVDESIPKAVRTPSLKLSSGLSPLPATSPVAAQRQSHQVAPQRTAPVPAPIREAAAARAESAADFPPGTIDKTTVDTTPQEKAERLYRSALVLLNQGRGDDGLTTLRAALREDPSHIAARQMLIKTYLDSRSWDSAQGVLGDGLALHPQQGAWAMLLARLFVERGDNEGALKVLETHEAAGRSSAAYQGAIAAMMQRLGRRGEAIGRFRQAVQLELTNGRWQLGLATALEADGQAAEAREAYQRAVAAGNLPAELQAFAAAKLK